MNDSGINKSMWVFAGAGHDLVYGGELADWLYGGPGDDEVVGRPGGDFIYGEEGNDMLEGHNGADRIEGGAGDDIIEGWGDSDTIYGGPGDDTIRSGMPQGDPPGTPDTGDTVYGGDGNDRIDGYIGSDILYGDGQNDHAGSPSTAPGNDEIYGHDGLDFIFGGPGHDDLFAENDGGYINAGTGDDIVNDDPPPGYPQVDLVADVDGLGEFDAFYGSDDNREENGFSGGKKIGKNGPRHELQIHVNHNSVDLTGYGLRLDISDSIAVEIWDSETGGQLITTPVQWTIGGPSPPPAAVYLQGAELGVTDLTLTVLDPTTNNPVVDRPLRDYMMVIVEA